MNLTARFASAASSVLWTKLCYYCITTGISGSQLFHTVFFVQCYDGDRLTGQTLGFHSVFWDMTLCNQVDGRSFW